jgi:hypothetical protein
VPLGPIVLAPALAWRRQACRSAAVRFSEPRRQSLAVGGAFAGLADDATATFANPAGLTQLGASEVSVEFRGSWVTTQFLQAGRLSGTVTNIGNDTIAGPVSGDSSGSHVGVGFAAGVYTHPSHRWVIAGYRHSWRVDQSFCRTACFADGPTGVTRATPAGRQSPGRHYGLRCVRLMGSRRSCRGSRFCRVYIRHELGLPPLRHGWVLRPPSRFSEPWTQTATP